MVTTPARCDLCSTITRILLAKIEIQLDLTSKNGGVEQTKLGFANKNGQPPAVFFFFPVTVTFTGLKPAFYMRNVFSLYIRPGFILILIADFT